MDYLIDLMHLIKNLGEHVCDSLIGADFDDKVREWAKEQGIKANWWATGVHAPMRMYRAQVAFRCTCTRTAPRGLRPAYTRTLHVSSKRVM